MNHTISEGAKLFSRIVYFANNYCAKKQIIIRSDEFLLITLTQGITMKKQ